MEAWCNDWLFTVRVDGWRDEIKCGIPGKDIGIRKWIIIEQRYINIGKTGRDPE